MSLFILLHFYQIIIIIFIIILIGYLKIYFLYKIIAKQQNLILCISHEVKTPIANSIFQADCIINNIKYGNYKDKYLIQELNILNFQLLKSGKLLNKLFDIEKYDKNKYKLTKERVNLSNFLKNEINIFKKINKNIHLKTNILGGIIYFIDKILFTQVIDNILNNSIKYSSLNNPIIKITSHIKGNFIYIIIEDNGIGFNQITIKSIFNKYSTGKISGTGLGIGLYICKKIIKLHKGIIKADKSKNLGGAKFTIKLPK